MRRIIAYSGSLFLAAFGLVLTGCQSGPLSQQLHTPFHGAENTVHTDERAASAAETPIRKSVAKKNGEQSVGFAEQVSGNRLNAREADAPSQVIPPVTMNLPTRSLLLRQSMR